MSESPRPRILSSPFSPEKLSYLSVPESRPPLLGQPGRSFVVKTPSARCGFLRVRVPSHRASSDAVASGERAWSAVASVCPCPLGDSERVPAQPITIRRTAHPIRKAPTRAMRCLWRTTTHPPSLCRCPPLLTPRSMPHDEARRISTEAYSPKCLEGRRSRKFISSILHSRGPVPQVHRRALGGGAADYGAA
jgi:hypothetical protein